MNVKPTVCLANARRGSALCLSSEFGFYEQNVETMHPGEGAVLELFHLPRLSGQAERVRQHE